MKQQSTPRTAPTMADVLQAIHNSQFDYTAFECQCDQLQKPAPVSLATKQTNAEVASYTFGDDTVIYAKWICDPKFRNHLFLNGEEFLAKNLVWKYDRIAWVAGGGWPLYEIPCPPSNRAHKHNIVITFGGRDFSPCSTPASGVGQHMTAVYAWVDDDKYDDNTGYFEVVVTAYSRE